MKIFIHIMLEVILYNMTILGFLHGYRFCLETTYGKPLCNVYAGSDSNPILYDVVLTQSY